MLTGHALLVAAALAAALTLLATAWTLWADGALPLAGSPRQVGQLGSWVAFVLTGAATVLLLLLLMAGDFSVRYVWQHSATVEPVLRRMSALLAGQEGSFLVWALFASAVAAWTAWRWRSGGPARASNGLIHLVATGVALAVLLLALATVPFQSFADAFPALDVQTAPLEGRGLNPVLANPWMVPHTLLTFAAFALIGLLFAVAVCQLLRVAQGRATEARQCQRHALNVTRWAWLLLSAALLTGIVWAYEEMTFGWFWSWDPVEAATLSVWLLLTAAVHAFGETGSGRRQLVATPLLVALAFVAIVFASFVTRSGLHPSVHAFASGTTGRWLGVALVLLVGVLATLAVTAWRTVPAAPVQRPWLFWTVWLLLAAAGLITWGLVYPMAAAGLLGRARELHTGFFALWGSLVAVAMLLLMGFGLQRAHRRRREAVLTLAFFAALTAITAALKPIAGLELAGAEPRQAAGTVEGLLSQASILVFLPPAVYALLAVGERWWAGLTGASRRARLTHTGSAIAHVGAVATIVGVTFATLLTSTVTIGVDPVTQVGSADGVQVRIGALETAQRTDAAGAVIEARETATVEVRSAAGLLAAGSAILSTYPERDMARHARVLIHRGLLADTQVIFHGLAELRPDGVPVTVRRIPLINLVWGGLLLLVGGMALITSVRGAESAVPAARPRSHDTTGHDSLELVGSRTAP